jgi:translocation and assembly module TamB
MTSRHRILRWLLVVVPLAVLILFAGAALVLHSQAFQAYALRKITQSASESTGAQIHVQSMAVKWYPLAIELSGISAQNPAAISETPLFSANRVQVSLEMWALLHRRVEVHDLVVDHPIVDIRTESDGRTNLPTPLQSDQSTSSGFAVRIGHLVIQNGLLQYDDRRIPLSVELRGFRTQVSFNRLTNSYKGNVAYDVGRLQTASTRTFDHRAEMRFDADARHCTIEQITLSTMHSQFGARGELTDYANPVFTGNYESRVVADDVRWILRNAPLPSGEIALQGKLNYRTAAGPTWADRTVLEGQLESAGLLVSDYQSRATVRAVRASYRLDRGQLRLKDVRADAFGGHLTSDSSVVDLVHNSGRVRWSVRGASVEQAVQAAIVNPPQTPQIAALADLDIDATWKNTPSNAIVRVTGNFRKAPETSTSRADGVSAAAIPIEGHIALDYDSARNRASFQPSTLRTGSAELTANGVLSRDSSLQLRLMTHDLHQLGELISAASPPSVSQRISAYDLHGAGELSGNLSGAVSDPRFDGQISFTDLQLASTKWRTLKAHFRLDSQALAISDGSLANAAQGRLTFSGKTQLAHWALDPLAPLSLQARIDQLSAADLQHIAASNYPVEGMLNGELSVSGSQQHPAARGDLELSKGVVWNEPISSLSVKADADKQTIRLDADARASAGDLSVHVEYEPSTRRYKVSASIKQLILEKVTALQSSMNDVTGHLTADVSGAGTIDSPQLSGHVQMPELQVRGEKFQQVDAHIDVRDRHTEFRLRSAVEQTSIDAKGTVELTPGYPANVTVDSGKIPIGPLLAQFFPATTQSTSGQMEVHASLRGPLQNPAQLQGHAEIPTLELQTSNFSLANAGPVNMSYRAGILEIAAAEFKGQGTDLRLSGTVPLEGPGNLNVSANGDVDLAILQPFTNGGHSSGRVTLKLHALGPTTKPAIDGRVKILDAVFSSDALPVGIESLNGDLSIAGNHIDVSNLSAKAGGGTVAVTGTAVYGPTSQFNLALRADSVRIRQNGVRSVLGADLSWNGSSDSSTLAGRVTVDKLAFNSGSDLSEVLAQFSDDSTVSDPSSFARGVKLNVSVQSSQNLNLASSQLSIAGSADLNARGTLAQPVILGRISLNSGEVFFLGKRFEIDSGTIAFSNPARTEPVVNLHVKTVVQQYNITANLVGPIDRLKTTYTSDPALSTADIINLLAFGQTTADAASKGATPASVGAESAVANAVGGQVASQVQKLTGISQLTLNPLAGNQNPGSQVAIQQRISGNVLLTFSTDVTSAQNQSIQVQYQARKNVTVSVLRDENGGYGIDVRYHKVF